jgi:hypothetical protein
MNATPRDGQVRTWPQPVQRSNRNPSASRVQARQVVVPLHFRHAVARLRLGSTRNGAPV